MTGFARGYSSNLKEESRDASRESGGFRYPLRFHPKHFELTRPTDAASVAREWTRRKYSQDEIELIVEREKFNSEKKLVLLDKPVVVEGKKLPGWLSLREHNPFIEEFKNKWGIRETAHVTCVAKWPGYDSCPLCEKRIQASFVYYLSAFDMTGEARLIKDNRERYIDIEIVNQYRKGLWVVRGMDAMESLEKLVRDSADNDVEGLQIVITRSSSKKSPRCGMPQPAIHNGRMIRRNLDGFKGQLIEKGIFKGYDSKARGWVSPEQQANDELSPFDLEEICKPGDFDDLVYIAKWSASGDQRKSDNDSRGKGGRGSDNGRAFGGARSSDRSAPPPVDDFDDGDSFAAGDGGGNHDDETIPF